MIAGLLLICAPVKADKFWLADPKAEQSAAAGSSPDVIEGALVQEDEDGYHIRVEGGVIVLAKSLVFHIEKEAVTLDEIVQAEAANRKRLDESNQQRIATQKSERRSRKASYAEASAKRSAQPVAAPSRQIEDTRTSPDEFDPILGLANDNSQYTMMRDAQLAWRQTKDRRYLKMLRQLRRLR